MNAYKKDSALLADIARGESDGLTSLYDRYKTLVFSIALHVLGNREDAEEATLDVFGKVWEKAGDYSERKASVKTWLAAIARNRAIDVMRRRNTRFTAQSPTWADACLDCMPASEDQHASLEMAAMHKEMVDALSRLPANQRDALALAYFRGLSHSQIADELGEPLGMVKTRIRSALQTLRNSLLDPKKVGLFTSKPD